MTDQLLEQVEEKVMTLLAELESQRKENHFLKQENAQFKAEKTQQHSRLQGLVSLLNVMDTTSDHLSEQGDAVTA